MTVKLDAGGKTLYINNQAKKIDVSPLVRSSRACLPARYIAEAFGYKVAWDEAESVIVINRN